MANVLANNLLVVMRITKVVNVIRLSNYTSMVNGRVLIGYERVDRYLRGDRVTSMKRKW